MSKKLQVFVSSTYDDLKEERQTAVLAILQARHIPAGMELFAAGSDPQLTVIRKWIDDSDVFMLILGGRYGSIDAKTGKSYIQLEYEYAVKTRKPLFAVTMSDKYLEAKVKAEGSAVLERVHGVQFAEFRSAVLSRLCHRFDSLDGLTVAVMKSLMDMAEDGGLSGWVRSSDSASASEAVLALSRANHEIGSLRTQLDAARAEISELQRVARLPSLSDAAIRLLRAAAQSSGRITHDYSGNTYSWRAGHYTMQRNRLSSREDATWRAAAVELHGGGFVEFERAYEGSPRTIYRLLKAGYDFVDGLTGVADVAEYVSGDVLLWRFVEERCEALLVCEVCDGETEFNAPSLLKFTDGEEGDLEFKCSNCQTFVVVSSRRVAIDLGVIEDDSDEDDGDTSVGLT